MNKRRAGFTLIEILIVITIIAILVGVGYNSYQDAVVEARENTARYNLKIVRDAISRYFKDRMVYPTSFEALHGQYLQQPVDILLVTPLAGNAKVRVEVPTVAAIADINRGPNIFHLIPAESADCTWIYYDFGGAGSGGKQMRSIKIEYNGTVMPW